MVNQIVYCCKVGYMVVYKVVKDYLSIYLSIFQLLCNIHGCFN